MDWRRIVLMVVLLSGLAWAVSTSPLTKRLFGGTPQRPAPLVGALAPLAEPPRGVRGATPATSAPVTPLSPDELVQWRGQYATAWQRDPFFTAAEEQDLARPQVPTTPAKAIAPLPSYTVKTILISGTEKVATLDGRLVAEGDAVGEERVLEIRPDGIVLERAGQQRRLVLPGGTVSIDDTSSSAIRGR